MANDGNLTGVERFFGDNQIIVSKTDLKGKITYANEVFLRVAQFTEEEVLGQPHNIIRHPDMPACVFKLLWDTIQDGREIFAYVVNRTKCGDHYWVFAHVTPSLDEAGKIIGYHSSRRRPEARVVKQVQGIYKVLLDEEKRHRNAKEAMAASTSILVAHLEQAGVGYDEFMFSLA